MCPRSCAEPSAAGCASRPPCVCVKKRLECKMGDNRNSDMEIAMLRAENARLQALTQQAPPGAWWEWVCVRRVCLLKLPCVCPFGGGPEFVCLRAAAPRGVL